MDQGAEASQPGQVTPARLRLSADLLLVVITIFWGISFALVKQALDSTGPMNFLFLRFGSAALLLAPFALWQARDMNRTTLIGGAAAGVFLFGAFAFQSLGLVMTSASRSGMLTGMNVILVPLLSMLILRRAPAPAPAIGAGLAFLGLVLLTGFDSVQTTPFNLGDVLTIFCALSIAGHVLTLARYAPGRNALVLGWLQLVVVALASLLWAGADSTLSLDVPFSVLGSAVFLALTATILAFWGQSWAQRYTTPTRTALIFTLEPVVAVLFAAFYLGEAIGPWGIAGGGLIVGGIVLAEVKPRVWNGGGRNR